MLAKGQRASRVITGAIALLATVERCPTFVPRATGRNLGDGVLLHLGDRRVAEFGGLAIVYMSDTYRLHSHPEATEPSLLGLRPAVALGLIACRQRQALCLEMCYCYRTLDQDEARSCA